MASTIGDLGEFGLISRVTAQFPHTPEVILGPGDDAAVVRAPHERVVASTDLLVEGQHFTRGWSDGVDVGHKAVAQNLADLAAMAARPTALLIGLAAPGDLEVSWLDGLTEGLRSACAAAGTTVAGGDVVRSDTLTIAVTALGALDAAHRVLRRSGAGPGELVAVCGDLGMSAAGLALLQAGRNTPRACVQAHLRPEPPLAAGPQAAHLGATAMLDVSDGLVQDLGHLATASNVVIDIHSSALPRRPELDLAVDQLRRAGHPPPAVSDLILGGGEDHALVATFPTDTKLDESWVVIGQVTARGHPEPQPTPRITVDGQPCARTGWDHLNQA